MPKEYTWVFTRERTHNGSRESEVVKARKTFNSTLEAINYSKLVLGWSNPPKWQFWKPRWKLIIEVESDVYENIRKSLSKESPRSMTPT